MRHRAPALLCLWVLGPGCLPAPAGEPSPGSSGDPGEGSSSTTVAPDNTSLPGSTTTDGTSGAESTTGGIDESSTGTTGEGPASVCDPQPEDAPYHLELDFDETMPELPEAVVLDVSCQVASISAVLPLITIDLDCEDGPHVLELADLGPIDLGMGETVELHAHVSQPWWRQTHVLLLRNGEVLLAGMMGESLPSGDAGSYSPAGTFFDPLGIEVIDACEPEPEPDLDPENGGDFITMPPCTWDQRRALRFTLDARSVDVYDAGRGMLGELSLSVSVARNHVQTYCSDTPGGWYAFLAVRTTS